MKKSLRKGELSTGHARALLSVEDKNKQLNIYREAIKNRLSVRDIEVLIYGAPKSGESRKAKKKKAEVHNPELQSFIDRLSSHLGTKVRIHGAVSRGRIEIEYYSQEDLERLLEMITGVKIPSIETTEEVTVVEQVN
jgi:ParB family transcriptional regulator, chromosome partitioning protein